MNVSGKKDRKISMRILGIIAEFNPLHTGHEYLIRRLRRETGADFCVVAMSGDYVQRGEPAFFSKSLRTRAALLSGADLVLELPLSVSTGSAEYFAAGAVSLLDRLGCVTHLGFGSENGVIKNFLSAGKLLSEEPEEYRVLLKKNLKAGMNFPRARYEALSAFLTVQASQAPCFPDAPLSSPDTGSTDAPALSAEDLRGILPLLNSPNNILGLEYIKALSGLRSSMIPVTAKRIGAGYHDGINAAQRQVSCGNVFAAESLSPAESAPAAEYASASGLRKAFLSASGTEEINTLLKNYIPEACRALYLDALRAKQYVTFDDFYLPLYYTLEYSTSGTLSGYQDVTPRFSERLLRLFKQCSSAAELSDALKTKDLTATGINRRLLHILLHLTKDTVRAEKEQGYALYARILGFCREAKPLLSLIKKNASIPLVSKPADASGYLSPLASAQLEQTVKASELYRAALPGARSGSEYAQRIVVL